MCPEHGDKWWTSLVWNKKRNIKEFWAQSMEEDREPRRHKDKKRKKGPISRRMDTNPRV